MMCLPLCVSQFCCTLNSKGISRVWGVTYWIQSLQERLEPMGDELSLLCAAALRGAFWKQVTDDFQISCQPRFPPKSILFVAALALKALCTSHPFFFFALMKLILGWHQASSCWVCFVWQERDEKKKQPVWKGQKNSALQKVPSSQAQVGRNLYALWWKRNLKVQPTKTTLWGRKIVQGCDVFLIFMPCIWRRSAWPLKNTHKPRGA